MANKNTIEIQLEVRDDGTVKIRQFADNAEKGLKGTTDAVDKLNSKSEMSLGLWGKLGATLVGFVGFQAIKAGIMASIEASDQQARSIAGLDAALKSMGRYTPELRTGLLDTASALQRVTITGDEATIEGQKFLVTYRGITDELLPRTSAAMLDLAALMGGDTTQAANMLGKASMGMTGELRRFGIAVDEATFKAEGFVGVLGQIEQQVKGQAEALRNSEWGGLPALANAASDVEESLGDILALAFGDTMREWAASTETFAGKLQRVVDIAKTEEDVLWGLTKGFAVSRFGEDAWNQAMKDMGRITATGQGGFRDLGIGNPQSYGGAGQTGGGLGAPAGASPGAGSKAADEAFAKGEEENFKFLELAQQRTDMEKFMAEDRDAALEEMRRTRLEREIEGSGMTLENLQAEHEAALEIVRWRGEQEVANTLKTEEQLRRIKEQSAQAQYKVAVGLGTALLSFAGLNSKEIFLVTQAFEFGKAMVSAFAAYNLALANPPGPPWTIPVAEAARNLGLWNAAAIAATTIGQLSVQSSGGTGAGSYTSPTITSPGSTYSAAEPEQETRGVMNVYVENLYGDDAVLERLAEKLSELVDNRDVVLHSSYAKSAGALA